MTNPQPKRGPSRRILTTLSIELTINEREKEAVNALLAKGFYGSTPSDVVRRILDKALLEMADKGMEMPL